ncbi:LysM peptidoglycan-binding domain-containing M23 family metallopeptidase [Deinococcus aquatilis]|jgi:murein DD-endopeptidase MepM/ murein hydrolase activator NlpD|uniref:LysM peptidoglycan-binding domain-containing M23 family metallopeptidase n=1 Tax=Deinococcus aquatilis TaxID=519440 RepID=UPI000364BA33|nr:M23 family metallopeptidase [Deinococcus aquatilis]
MLIRALTPLLLAALSLAGAMTVRVQPGDTLTRMAVRAGSTPQAFMAVNPGLNPNRLQVGAVLQVPSPTARSVVIQAGDTLSSVAKRRGLTVSALLKANPGINPQRALQIGQRLQLPNAVVVRSAPSSVSVRTVGIRVTAILPVQGRVTTPYRGGHEGLDLAAPAGTFIRAALGGVVTESRFDGRTGWGWTVVVDHGGGLKTRYSHNSVNLARLGARVNTGDVIARVGSTGNSSGPHVDYRVSRNGQPLNPAALN